MWAAAARLERRYLVVEESHAPDEVPSHGSSGPWHVRSALVRWSLYAPKAFRFWRSQAPGSSSDFAIVCTFYITKTATDIGRRDADIVA